MILTPHLDIGIIQKYYPNLSTEQIRIINERANSIIDCINSPHLMRVKQYKGIHSTDIKDTKIILPLNIHGQLGSNNGLSEGIILSGPHEGEKPKRDDREQGIITLCYELNEDLPENDRLRSLFLHNMASLEELSIVEQYKMLEKNGISNIDELSRLIRESINYRTMHSCSIRHPFAESKIFKKIP